MERKYIDRREFLKWMAAITGGAVGSAALGGCVVPTPETITETVVFEKEVPVAAEPMEPMYMGTVIRTLSNGAIIEFDKSVEDDLQLLINNRPVGRGGAAKIGE